MAYFLDNKHMQKIIILIYFVFLSYSCSEIKLKNNQQTDISNTFCRTKAKFFEKYNWKSQTKCKDIGFKSYGKTPLNHHLIYTQFPKRTKKTYQNTTLVLCGVHGDEITPVKFCFNLIDKLKLNPQILSNEKVIIAPLVTTDSFFIDKPTRQNANKIDINRNFPTKDWNYKAEKLWKTRYHKDPRRYPGEIAGSEIETKFQIYLITKYKPQKIITVHAPLNLIDYDGPTIKQFKGKGANSLLKNMSSKTGYRIIDYPFFTGSLGNWAGNELKVPTYTLELPDTNYKKADYYFEQFYSSLISAIHLNLHEH